ncbi:unnamed protein product, partial [Prorocentrum cordatum]
MVLGLVQAAHENTLHNKSVSLRLLHDLLPNFSRSQEVRSAPASTQSMVHRMRTVEHASPLHTVGAEESSVQVRRPNNFVEPSRSRDARRPPTVSLSVQPAFSEGRRDSSLSATCLGGARGWGGGRPGPGRYAAPRACPTGLRVRCPRCATRRSREKAMEGTTGSGASRRRAPRMHKKTSGTRATALAEREKGREGGGGARALTSPRNCRCTAPRTSGAPAGRRSAPGRPAARRRGCTCHELSHDRRELLRQAILGARLVIGTLRHKTCKLRQQLERAAFRVGFLARGPEAEDQGAPHVLEATDAALLPQEADLLPRLELNPCRLHELLEDILDLILLLGRGTVIGGQQRVAGRLVQPPDAQEGQRDGLVTAGHGYRRGWLGRAGAAAHMA